MNISVIKKQVHRIITKKGSKILFLLLLVALLITGCDHRKIENTTIEQKDIEAALSKRNLLWTVESSESWLENQSIYILRDENGIFCSIDTRIDHKERELTLIFDYPNHISTEQLEQFNLNILPQTLHVAGELYGNISIVNKIKKSISLNINNVDPKGNGVVITNQHKDDYLSLTLLPYEIGKDIYKTQKLLIANHSAYERRIYEQANYWSNPLNGDRVEIENSSVSNIKELTNTKNSQDNQESYFVIKGSLKKIRKPTDISEPFKSISNNFISYKKSGYLIADLVDETGSIEVYLSPSAFNKDDLNKTRNHYIYYHHNKENSFALIRYSVLEE